MIDNMPSAPPPLRRSLSVQHIAAGIEELIRTGERRKVVARQYNQHANDWTRWEVVHDANRWYLITTECGNGDTTSFIEEL